MGDFSKSLKIRNLERINVTKHFKTVSKHIKPNKINNNIRNSNWEMLGGLLIRPLHQPQSVSFATVELAAVTSPKLVKKKNHFFISLWFKSLNNTYWKVLFTLFIHRPINPSPSEAKILYFHFLKWPPQLSGGETDTSGLGSGLVERPNKQTA